MKTISIFSLTFSMLILQPHARLFAQTAQSSPSGSPTSEADLLKQLDTINTSAATPPPFSKPAPAASKNPGDENGGQQTQKPPTEITATQEATYDEKTRKAVFTGNVRVKDPQVDITCDMLTAFLRKEATDSKSKADEKSPTPASAKVDANEKGNSGASAGASPKRGSGLDRAIAEGHVIIIQEKPATDGGQPQRNIGKSAKADYDANTGDVTLSGWPEVSQGINTQVATSAETIMIMNRDRNTMITHGPSKTVIQEQDEQPKPTTTTQRQ